MKLSSISLAVAMSFGIVTSCIVQANEVNDDIALLKEQVRDLQKKTGGNHINFNVDYRVTMDSIDYQLANGSSASNSSLISNRLLINMGYQYNEKLVFSSQLSYNKIYGDTANHSQINQSGYADFDWVVNENLQDNALRVKEAYFLYLGDAFLGNDDIPWTFSVGRRPSTNGFLANNREGFDKAKSPLGHSINVEFDGLSLSAKLEKVLGITGSAIKLCTGRGLSNARSRFDELGLDYANDNAQSDNIDMVGFIITPYNDGQYNVQAQIYTADNLIGFDMNEIMGKVQSAGASAGEAAGAAAFSYAITTGQSMEDAQAAATAAGMVAGQEAAMTAFAGPHTFRDFGGLNNFTLSMEVNGIGEFINDFLDDTRIFASYSISQTDPDEGMAMLGSTEKETGNSYWVGINVPGFVEGDSFGVEFNHGSKYWRSFTYGEDTLIGSKIATRGDAFEVYYNLPLIDDVLTFQLRYTKIDYDYTGSNGFFGSASGTPMTMAEAQGMADMFGTAPPVESAEDIRATLRYTF
ncbi:MAG: DUF3373 domain-containing protein [Colwellia sp.]